MTDTPAPLPFARGVRSVANVKGGAVLYDVVFGQARKRPKADSVSFDDIELSESLDRRPFGAWFLIAAAHALLICLPIVALMPSPPVDTVPEQGMTVDLVSEREVAAGRDVRRAVPAGASAASEGRKGHGEAADILASPDVTRDEVVPAGEAATVDPPAPSFAAGPATPPSRDLPPVSGIASRGSGTVSAEELEWEGAIVERIEKRKRFPKAALAAGAEDDVILRLVIDREGKVVRAEIAKSRGNAALNAEVLALAKRAGPYPRPPASVAGATISMLVPVEFSIKDKRAK